MVEHSEPLGYGPKPCSALVRERDGIVEAEPTTAGTAAVIDRAYTDTLDERYLQSFVDAGSVLSIVS